MDAAGDLSPGCLRISGHWSWGMCRDTYSAEMHTGERPSMFDCMNKRFPLSRYKYNLCGNGLSTCPPKCSQSLQTKLQMWFPPK